jgi:cobalt-zinc-cadmium resistance protein CzcA
MISKIVSFSIKNKLIVLFFIGILVFFGFYAVSNLSVGAVPDITNNQVQVITTSRNLSTQDIEQFITRPVEAEMVNLPRVKEVRSISKFGLSVVTVVFEDDIGIYLPRQLISEKLKTIAANIPPGFGTPEMGPISTGLGEIYQYTLEVEPEYKDFYTVADLREIQDWVIKKQLSGIPGVIEINTWGGYLKQYEVSFNSNQLKSLNTSVSEIILALESNNQVSGGSYLEKNNQSYFIRGEGQLKSIDDIKKIVVKNVNQTPLLIEHLAEVKIGYSNRFGAITGNGEGEKVLGQIMMLKGANSNQVINQVKNRIEEISSSLPKGVYINGFLERSELVNKTTFTIAENLILGCLIVIFVVFILLGNWRASLVIASVIPLCLLFTISIMYLLKMDANLMSLGAIDFGIIIDGAVIIVEFIVININKKLNLNKDYTASEIDNITKDSSTSMMKSAIFGQLIILIVFLPLMTLTGVEGKMFKPMALTFSFALISAMILCLTYVPVMSSLLIKPFKISENSLSFKIDKFLKNLYKPLLIWSFKHAKKIIVASLILLVSSFSILFSLGGEFIPTLDEGDFVIQPVLKTGTSLSKTIEITTKIEKIVLKNFPEVTQVVSRIGAAEVPTDPMSMEETDIIVKLKPKKDWVSASSKENLADSIKKYLINELPNIEIEFTQPIQMRFNELISGTRSDIGIKIYGEDLEILAKKANEIADKIKNIEGAADIIVEKTEGLPQIEIKYNRQKIAQFGLNISDINKTVEAAFAGVSLSDFYENEKRFEIVLRMNRQYKNDINDVKNLNVSLANGNQIPLKEVADINYKTGPAKISRDDAKRRIIIGVNVRNRDIQSVVDEIKEVVSEKVKIPEGYYLQYGGQFENMQSAKNRLMLVLPLSLIIIFIMLYFAFSSVKAALLVYSAIPLATIGGILFLWFRNMPLSVSAGVGFIALFGIAVLNGIILIEHFSDLKKQSKLTLKDLLIVGAEDRLRPVLLTALAAALGFLPMAISSSAGAEVQKPLATVVIGGLVSSTLLTLIVLPILYYYFEKIDFRKLKLRKYKTFLLIFLMINMLSFSQSQKDEMNQLIKLSIENNLDLKAYHELINATKNFEKTAYQLDKTNIYYNYDPNNLTINNFPLHVYGISQNLKFPSYYNKQNQYLKSITAIEQSKYQLIKNNIAFEISKTYNQILYKKNLTIYFQKLDSMYRQFETASNRKYELGQSNELEKILTEAKRKQITVKVSQLTLEIDALINLMTKHTNFEDFKIKHNQLIVFDTIKSSIENDYYTYFQKHVDSKQSQINWQKQNYFPDLTVEVFNGINSHENKNFLGVKFGIGIPLFEQNNAKLKTLKLEQLTLKFKQESHFKKIENFKNQKNNEILAQKKLLEYYHSNGKSISQKITNIANTLYKKGDINFFQYIQSIENAIEIEVNYLDALEKYNQLIFEQTYINLSPND